MARPRILTDSPRDGIAWRHEVASTFRRQVHTHAELEFNLVEAGAASYLVGGRRVDLQPRTLIWLFPDHDHVLINESANFVMWIALFKPEALRRWCRTNRTATLRSDLPDDRFWRRVDVAEYDRIAGLCREATGAGEHPDHLNAVLGYLLSTAWAATTRGGPPPAAASLHPSVDRAAAMLRQGEAADSLDELCDAVGLSPSRLGRLFKQQTGLSITAYRNAQRIERFLRLYGDGSRRTMLDAALAAGFGSYPQFHRAFKHHMNQGPADYRRRLTAGQPDQPMPAAPVVDPTPQRRRGTRA